MQKTLTFCKNTYAHAKKTTLERKDLHLTTLSLTNSERILKFSLIFLFLGLGIQVFGQTTIMTQDFETNLSGYTHTPSQTPASDPGDQYFHRAVPSDNDIYETGSVGPYTGVTNSYLFVGSNPNTINGGSPGVLELTGVNISGYTDLELSADFGAVSDDWDAADLLSVEYNWDGGSWTTLYDFASSGTNDPLELGNNATGGSNTANGTVLVYALQTIVSDNFTGSGTILNLRIVCDANSNYEAFGVDNIVLKGTATGGNTVTFHANDTSATGSMSPQTSGSTANLTSNAFILAGYTFDHWNTQADGLGTDYADGVSYGFGTDLDLYAQWAVDVVSCGNEDFANSNAGSGYGDNSFTGNNGVTWTYVESRDENGDANSSGISGNALMLRRSSDDSKVTSSSVAGGIGDFSVKLYKGFTGVGNRQVELFVNSVSQGTSTVFDDYLEHTFTVTDINISGNVIVEIRNTTSKQVIVDDITWTCYSSVPEIDVLGNLVSIVDGDVTPSLTDNTDFGDVDVASGSNANTFTIENTGTGTLTLTGTGPTYIAISGANAGDFTVTANPSNTIAHTGTTTTTFEITFDPSGAGARNATITIANDDADENPYTFDVTGNGTLSSFCTFNDDFDRANSATVGGGWTESASGNSEIVSNELSIGTGSGSGTDFVYQDMNANYTTILDSLSTVITWEFNMRQSRSNPSGFNGGAYGVAFVLGGTTSDLGAGNGYAVVHGNTSSPDALRLVRYAGGLGANANITDMVVGTDYNADHLSVRVTFDPATDTWELFSRDDGSSFADPSTLTGAHSEGTVVNTTYTSSNTRYIGAYWNHATGASEVGEFDNVCISTTPITEEINITGNSVSIADGDVTPALGDHTDFGSSEVGGTPVTRTFTIENIGAVDLTLDGTGPTYVAISGAHAGDFSVTANPTTPIAASSSTTFTVTFTPGALGTRSATLTIANSDADEDPYTFNIEGEGINSLSSDIANDVSFSYSSDIDYTAYQVANITSSGHSVAVWRFTIRDGGPGMNDVDGFPTILDDITFSSVAGIDNIRAAALFDGNSLVDNNEVIDKDAGTIAFTGINYSTADNSSRNLTLRITFESTVTDNEQMSFTIASANLAITGASSSSFATFGIVSSTGADRNRIEVTADQLAYGQQPSNASQGLAMTPAVTVRGEDANGNLDLDFTDNVDITSSGTLIGSPVGVSAVNGIATFGSLVHSATRTGLTLNAAHSTFSSVASATFNITTFSYAAGDYRPLVDNTDLSYNGAMNWEYFDGTSWGPNPDVSCGSPCAPQNAATTPTRVIINRPGITGGANTANSYNDIVVLSTGELILNDVDFTPAAEFILSGKTLEVQDGGKLEIVGDIELNSGAFLTIRDGATLKLNSPNMTNDHPIWNGTELFEGGSLLSITDWDWGASAASRSLLNTFTQISNNANGYKFGEVVFDATPTDNWTIVNGSVLTPYIVSENDFTVINRSPTYFVGVMSNNEEGISCEFGGNLIVEDGDFAFGTSDSGDPFEQLITVKGDVEITTDGDVNLHKNAVNTATANASKLLVHGDFMIDGASSFNSDLPSPGTNKMELILTGDNFHNLEVNPQANGVPFIVEAGDSAVLVDYDLRFGDDSEIEIESGAYFDFGFNGEGTALNVIEVGSANSEGFHFRAGATLVVTSPGGIWDLTNTTTGNVQGMPASDKDFGQSGSTFYYVGKTDQETGDAFTAGQTTKDIYVILENDDDVLTVTATTGIASNNKLEIQSGIVDNTDAAYIYGNGDLTMTGGGLRTDVLATTATSEASSSGYVPLLSGTYNLSAGFVELYGSENQTLRGARDYYDLKISGNNSFGTAKTVSTAFTIAHNLDITDSSVFDIENRAMTGNANITMDNGLLRMSALGKTLPELLARSDEEPYDLTGGTIEWYGTTSSSSSQNIRGKDGSGRTIEYFNIEVNATSANVDDFNVGAQSGFELGGVMNVNAPAVLQLDNDDHIDDVGTPFNAGEFYLGAGATLKYGDIYGITTGSGIGATAGAIRVTGGGGRSASNFPTTASYGFVSPSDMVTGDALPNTVENLYVDKSDVNATVTLTNNLSIKTALQMDQGHIITDGNDFELGVSTANKGTLVYGQDSPQVPGFVIGAMERWFDGTNSGNASGLFPLGDYFDGDYRNKHSLIEYTSAPTSGGSLVTTFVTATNMGIAGVSKISTVTGGCTFDVETTEDEGYWNMERANSLSNDGTYTSAITGGGFRSINALCELTELKRPSGGGSWTAPGTHIDPTGTTAIPTVSRAGLSGFSDFGFGGSIANLLPIELLEFVAYKSGRNCQLEWVTSSEINNEKFIIEHSLNGVDFSTIGQVAGAGTSLHEVAYEFLHDQSVSGKNYYRLKQIDYDGTFSYSPIRLVEHDNAYPFAVQLLGNPIQNGELELSISSSKRMITTLAIFATDGRLVKKSIIDLAEGATVHRMPVDELVDGVYFLSVTNNEMNQGFKVIKSR